MAVSFAEYALKHKSVGQNGVKVISKARGLGLSIIWCGLLLGAFFLLVVDAAVSPRAAMSAANAVDASTITFSRASYTVAEDAGNGLIILLVDPPSDSPVTVTVSSGNIQAEGDKDFEGLRQSLVISPSEPAYTLSLTILDDDLVEGDEQLRLTLGAYQGVSPGVITETIVTIADNDVAYLSIGDVTVDEEAGSVVLLITQSVTSTLESAVNVRTHDGSATAPEDFSALSTTVVIPPGSITTTVTVQLQGDEEVEPTESFTVALEAPINAEVAHMTATVTIIDDDSFPEIELETAEANETDGVLSFVVRLSSTWAQTVTVEYATADGSAVAPEDYLASTGVLTLAPGSVTATVSVTLIEDQVEEPDEVLYLVLSNPVQALLSNAEVEGIIHDGTGGGFSELLFLPGLGR